MDTIKRVQDLMQVRDMNLCVLAKKCGISYSTIQTTARRGGQLSVETIESVLKPLTVQVLQRGERLFCCPHIYKYEESKKSFNVISKP